ncbi:MAG: response regulator [Melioribacteraceae bacterium]|nr:response regulator [Melioribacteraceae bacterium]MCF8265899.1 response regulator [Melioribacteraceae bacterium]MCF8413504.1 response regulator [Melioribacteraceae bacterium]MCF8431713.1 response regulator [Melioribacteraceae bacterium]
MRETNDSISILLIEDNEGDIRLTKEALSMGKIKNSLTVLHDGEEAIKHLKTLRNENPKVLPDLVILDLNLPVIDGLEVLKFIKNDKILAKLPVVVLTTSKDNDDIKKAYSYHANSFITKPIDWEQFVDVIKSIEEFWLSIVKLPPRSE